MNFILLIFQLINYIFINYFICSNFLKMLEIIICLLIKHKLSIFPFKKLAKFFLFYLIKFLDNFSFSITIIFNLILSIFLYLYRLKIYYFSEKFSLYIIKKTKNMYHKLYLNL